MFRPKPEYKRSLSRRHFLRAASALSVSTLVSQLLPAASQPAGQGTPETRGASSIRVGILLGTFRAATLEERLDAVKACGLDCIQLSLDCAGLPTMPESIPPELPGRIRAAAAARAITIAALDGTFNMSHPDAEQRKSGLRRLSVLAEACPKIGSSMIHICTGTRDPGSMWRRHPGNGSPEAWKDMVTCVRDAAEVARQTGVVLGFEPEVNNVVDSARKARRLLDEIGSPNLKVTIDPANIFHAGELPRMKEVLSEAFDLLGKDIVMAHAKDLDRDGDAGHKAAGEGKLDYDQYIALLQSSGFKGPLLLHGLSQAQVPGCIAFLREKLGRS